MKISRIIVFSYISICDQQSTGSFRDDCGWVQILDFGCAEGSASTHCSTCSGNWLQIHSHPLQDYGKFRRIKPHKMTAVSDNGSSAGVHRPLTTGQSISAIPRLTFLSLSHKRLKFLHEMGDFPGPRTSPGYSPTPSPAPATLP